MINLPQINHTYEDVKDIFTRYIHNPADIEKIHQAYLFAEKKHEGQLRKSGQPYVIHLIEVAYILATLQAGPSTIIAGFLHDTIEDQAVTKEELSELFGLEIATLVESLTKIQKLSERRDAEFVAEGHRKIFIAMANDIRVIIIKLADRLHNMRTLNYMTKEKQIRIARETLDVYAPIAHRLGINTIKAELEDLCLFYLEPEKYSGIEKLVNDGTTNRQKSILQLKKKLADMLIKTNIKFEIESRIKEIYSIYKKIYQKHRKFEEIYDIMALRIITETELNCYEILGYIHSAYKPIPGRFKDYIAMPKPNLYQSLHTTIVANDGNIFEIQIRTKDMDEIAESGVAAHWRYKENTKYDPKKEQKEIEEKLHWFSDFITISEEESSNAKEYMEALQHDIFDANVYVFTPLGKVVDLPSGATPLDFAYKIHSKVGDSAVGALINNVLVPLSYELKTGDVVEIKTSKNAPGPNEGWLKIAKTNFARSHIRKYLTKKNSEYLRNDQIQKGRQILLESFKELGLNEKEMMSHLNQKVLDKFTANSIEDLFVNISNRNPQPSSIIDFLELKKVDINDQIDNFIKKQGSRAKINSNQAVLVKGASNIMLSLASCCTPIPGDEIVGYISRGKGVKVHRKDCPNIQKEIERTIDVEWNKDMILQPYPVDIAILATDRTNLLIDILSLFAQNKVNCSKINAKQHTTTMTSTISCTIQVTDLRRLQDICNLIINIDGVYEVNRVTH